MEKFEMTTKQENDLEQRIVNLSELDTKLKQQTISIINGAWRKKSSLTTNKIMIGGSTMDGSMVAKYFQPIKKKKSMTNNELNVKFDILTATIPVEMKDLIVDNENSPNIVIVKNDARLCSLIKNEYDRMIFQKRQDSPFIESWTIKESYLNDLSLRDQLPYLCEMISECVQGNICIKEPLGEISKSSVAVVFDVIKDTKAWGRLSADMSIIFKICWWPTIADEWISRSRNWPSPEDIQELSSHCYVIAKPSSEEEDNIKTTEFSYHFQEIETKLSQRRSEKQEVIYLLSTSIFYRFIQVTDKDDISSYWAKTIMFWLMEKYPPDNEFWKQDFNAILKHFFNQLKIALQIERLDHYFNPRVNLLEPFIKSKGNNFLSIKTKLIDTIQDICTNIDVLLATLPTTQCYEFYEEIERTMANCSILMAYGFTGEKKASKLWNVGEVTDEFYGREEQLQDIHKYLAFNDGVALTGMSGIGKTETALTYAHRFNYSYEKVFWIPCENNIILNETYFDLADYLDVRSDRGTALNELAQQIYALPNYFLFIFDNMEPSQHSLLPTNQAFILTSVNASPWPGRIHNIPIKEFPENISTDFIKKKIPEDLYIEDGAIEIHQAVGGLPIGLKLCAAHIIHKNITISQMAEIICANRVQLLCRSFDERYASTLSGAFHALIEPFKADGSYWLLEILSYLDCKLIEYELLEQSEAVKPNIVNIKEDELLKYVEGEVSFALNFDKHTNVSNYQLFEHLEIEEPNKDYLGYVINNMTKLSILQPTDVGCYQMHTLIKDFVQLQITDHLKNITIINNMMEKQRQRFHCNHESFGDVWAHHAINIIEMFKDDDDVMETLESHKDYLCNAMMNKRNFQLQLKILETFLRYEEKVNHDDSFFYTQNVIGNTLLAMEKYDEAQVFIQKLYDEKEETLGETHKDKLEVKATLANCFLDMGGVRHAKRMLKEVWEVAETSLGVNDNNTLNYKYNYARCCSQAGEWDEAVVLLEQLNVTCEEVYGRMNDFTLKVNYELVACYREMKEYHKAKEMCEVSLHDHIKFYGTTHPDTFVIKNLLANCNVDTGEYETALKLLEECYAYHLEVSGEDHNHTFTAKSCMAVCYGKLGKTDDAIRMYEEVYEMQRVKLGETHPDTLLSKNNLAISNKEQGFPRKALELFLSVYQGYKNLFGVSHPNTIKVNLCIRACMDML